MSFAMSDTRRFAVGSFGRVVGLTVTPWCWACSRPRRLSPFRSLIPVYAHHGSIPASSLTRSELKFGVANVICTVSSRCKPGRLTTAPNLDLLSHLAKFPRSSTDVRSAVTCRDQARLASPTPAPVCRGLLRLDLYCLRFPPGTVMSSPRTAKLPRREPSTILKSSHLGRPHSTGHVSSIASLNGDREGVAELPQHSQQIKSDIVKATLHLPGPKALWARLRGKTRRRIPGVMKSLKAIVFCSCKFACTKPI